MFKGSTFIVVQKYTILYTTVLQFIMYLCVNKSVRQKIAIYDGNCLQALELCRKCGFIEVDFLVARQKRQNSC